MKKRSRIVSLGVLALTLTMMSTSLVGATMARYVTEVTGSATAKVAAWSFKANEGESTFTTINLGSTGNRDPYDAEKIKEDVIAPGTSGSFTITVDGTGSEVGVDYSVNIVAATGTTLPDNLAFKVGDTPYTLGNNITGTIDYKEGTNSMKKNVTVNWAWPFGEDDAKNDNSFANQDWTLNIVVTGKQTSPTETATP